MRRCRRGRHGSRVLAAVRHGERLGFTSACVREAGRPGADGAGSASNADRVVPVGRWSALDPDFMMTSYAIFFFQKIKR